MSEYPGIRRACLAIAYDNGGIHRERSEAQWDAEYIEWIARRTDPNIAEIDSWLSGLSDEDLDTVAAGEDADQQTLAMGCPEGTNELLTEFFEEVC